MSRVTRKGLILSRQDYRERDAIVTMVCPDEILHFFARGVQAAASKNKRLTNPFSIVEIELEQNARGSFTLIHGQLLDYCYHISEDLDMQAVCLVISEMVTRTPMTPGLYERLQALWTACQKREPGWPGKAALVICALLKEEGIAPGVDHCMVCGNTTAIASADIEKSGFLCQNHTLEPWKKASLVRLRQAVKAPYGKEKLARLEGFGMDELLFLVRWYEYYEQEELAGRRFLESVARL